MKPENDITPAIVLEHVDRKTLRILHKRFTDINQGRLNRTVLGLNENQKSFFYSLTLMLSINHPLLPGYVSKDAPSGIHGFTPSKIQIQSIKKLFRTFEYRRPALGQIDIYSVFLMGSTGTVAHAGGSDMDIWICHRPDLDCLALEQLIQKLNQIALWAKKEVALDVCFFAMDAIAFKNGNHISEVDDEDCGSSQHYLLLDEFYRSGLLLAGRYPAWWLIAPSIEAQYDEYINFILDRKFINADEIIDFGSMPPIPAGEFVGAGIWQLYKAIDSPYKSVVKILLTEAYAAEHPLVVSVSMIYKSLVHNGESNLNKLDPYILVYEKIEQYLLSIKEHERLELARQCFYLKTKVDVSKIKPNETLWRRLLMHEVTQKWGWSDQFIKNLDNQKLWTINDVNQRKKALVREMNLSYRFLLSFAKQFRTEIKINTTDITLLGRKLHAAFEKKRGKIEKANPKIAPDISEDALYFTMDVDSTYNTSIWNLYLAKPSPTNTNGELGLQPIKRSRSLVELLAWSYFNKIFIHGTRLHIQQPNLSVAQITYTYDVLEKHFPEQHGIPKKNVFQSPAIVKKILVMIEFANPVDYSQKYKNGFNYNDPLNQGTIPPSSVNQIDCIITNSWQETICYHYDGTESIVQCLIQLLMDMPSQIEDFSIQVEVGNNLNPDIVKQRISRILGEFYICFHKHKYAANARFILNIGNELYGIQPRTDQVFTKKFRDKKMLVRWLGEPQVSFSPLIFESYTDPASALFLAAKYNTPNTIQVHYEVHGNQAEVIIFDEKGSAFKYTTGFSSDQHFIAHTYRFLRAVIERQKLGKMEVIEPDLSRDEIEFFEIFVDYRKNTLVAKRQDIFHHIERETFTEIVAILDQTLNNQTSYRLFCDDKEFSQLEFGDQLYIEVAKYIQLIRNPQEMHYPVYLTDIDLDGLQIANSASSCLQVAQYLHYKQTIETSINNRLVLLN